MKMQIRSIKCLWIFIFIFTYLCIFLYSEHHILAVGLIILLAYRLANHYPKLLFLALIFSSIGLIHLSSQKQERLNFYQEFKQEKEYILLTEPDKLKDYENFLQGSATLLDQAGHAYPIIFQFNRADDADLSKHLLRYDLRSRVQLQETEDTDFHNFFVFNYSEYLEKSNLLGPFRIKQVDQFDILDKQRPSFLNVKNGVLTWLSQRATTPLLGLFNKMFFNLDSLDYRAWKANFAQWGIIHFFAISGFHIQLIIGYCDYLLRRLGIFVEQIPRYISLILLLYGYLVSWPVGAFRAIFSYILGAIVDRLDLPFSSLDQLSLIALFLILFQPSNVHNLSFNLSFLMAYVLYFYRQEQRENQPETKSIELMKLTFICSLFSWPISMNINHLWNPLQLLSIFCFTLCFDRIFLILLAGIGLLLLFPNLELLFHPIVNRGTEFYQLVGQWVERFYQSFSYRIDHLSLIWIFILISAAVYGLRNVNRPHNKRALSVILLVYLTFWSSFYWPRFLGNLTIIDVGQGDAILFQPALSTENWLIDTGGKIVFANNLSRQEVIKKEKKIAQRSIIAGLEAAGVQKIDKLIISHWDQDHCGNLPYLAEEFAIGQLILSEKSYLELNPEWQAFLDQFDVLQMLPGQEWRDPSNQVYLYYPPAKESADRNQHSLLTRIRLNQANFWTLGDLDQTGEESVLDLMIKDGVDYYKLSHHGSSNSSSRDFLEQLGIDLAIISVGKKNTYGHPSPEVLQSLKQLQIPYFSTAEQGAIRFVIDPFQDKIYLQTAMDQFKDVE